MADGAAEGVDVLFEYGATGRVTLLKVPVGTGAFTFVVFVTVMLAYGGPPVGTRPIVLLKGMIVVERGINSVVT